jgi:hypothetical protein
MDAEFVHGLVDGHADAAPGVRILTICNEFCAEALEWATLIAFGGAGAAWNWRK